MHKVLLQYKDGNLSKYETYKDVINFIQSYEHGKFIRDLFSIHDIKLTIFKEPIVQKEFNNIKQVYSFCLTFNKER